MNQFVTVAPIKMVLIRSGLGIMSKAGLVSLSIITVLTLHESVHLVVGRLLGIPAVFTGLTSVGITREQVADYPPLALALMNGIAPLFTVAAGFLALNFLTRHPASLPKHLRYFLAWWAMFGIPYLGLQLMLTIKPVDYSGNGADSSAVAGYLNLPMLIRSILCVLGFLYYLCSAVWLPTVMRAVTGNVPQSTADGSIPWWRRIPGLLFTAAAVACATFAAVQTLLGKGTSTALLEAFMLWPLAAIILTPWKTQAARAAARDWLLPGTIGMLALIPLASVDKNGNDFAEIWFISLPPIFAAVLFAARNISKLSGFTHICRR